MIDWVKRHPEVHRQRVERPLFVLGMLRTGTTILCELLARDPANRPLMKWEALDCVPPPRAESFTTDPRIARMVEETEWTYDLNPTLKAIHYEPGDGPTECVPVLGQHFRSQDYIGMFRIPSYNAWYERCDMTDAYRYHRRVLEVLQSEAPGRWSLKAPGHMYALEALTRVYPDARLVVTHRDPVEVMGSNVSMMLNTGGAMLTDGPWADYAKTVWRGIPRKMVGAMMEFRDRHPEVRFHDFRYHEFMADPIGQVRAMYRSFGDELSPEAESAMRAHLGASPQGRFGTHRYELAELGLSADAIRDEFRDYIERFDLPTGAARR
ncbi:MAG: sulfotransferase [Deltaproteobacteria bacterium]|nr:sulfotransferase [Deltaproteobacteria bacterium]